MGVGTSTFTAANGDQLVADSTGFSMLVVPGLVLITENAVIDPERSTGYFAGATGTYISQRLADTATGVNGVGVGGEWDSSSRVTPSWPQRAPDS